MADNVNITPGAGQVIAADDVGGVKYQRLKITTGGDGVADGDVSIGRPIPAAVMGLYATTRQIALAAGVGATIFVHDATARRISFDVYATGTNLTWLVGGGTVQPTPTVGIGVPIQGTVHREDDSPNASWSAISKTAATVNIVLRYRVPT